MQFQIMDITGHSSESFNKADKTSLAAAEARFAELTGQGFTAAKTVERGVHEAIHAFDSDAEQIIFAPHMVGG